MDLLLTYQLCTLGLLAMVFLCHLWLARSGRDRKGELKLPPEPPGAWPVVGHLPLLGGKDIVARTLGRMADEYGPVFMLRLGVHRTLVVSSQEAARECFTTCDRDFASRPGSAAGKHLGYDHTMFGFAPYGPLWREMRKLATVELLSTARLDKLRHIRAMEIDTRMRELYELCASGGGPPKVEMRQWFGDTTFNIVVRMVEGRRYDFHGAAAAAGDGAQMRRFQKVLTEFMYLSGVFVPSDAVPWLEWLDLRGYIKAMKRTIKEMDAVVDVWIEEHRQKSRSESSKAEGDQDFIDVMLSTMEGVDLAGVDPDIAIKATVLNLVIAGTDTSALTLTWALALLLNHRRVLDKVRDELDREVGAARKVEELDVGNLVYLQAVMKETMRLFPAGPLSVPHEATRDCRVGGNHVPAGTRLLTNLWKLHRDPRVWKDPLEFRPERFLTCGEMAEVDGKGKHFEYLPFGSGRRMCPGVALALQVTQLTLARLVHGFELRTPGGEPVDMGEGLGLTITKAAPLEVLFSPRLAPQPYTSTASMQERVRAGEEHRKLTK